MEMHVRIIRTDEQNTAWVEAIAEASNCHSCSSSKNSSKNSGDGSGDGSSSGGCGADNIGRMFLGSAPHRFRVIDPIGCHVGDEAIIDIADGSVVRSASLVYLLPLLLVFTGAILASQLANPAMADLASILGAATGLALAAAWLWYANQHILHNPRYQPVIRRTIPTHFFVLKEIQT